MVDGRRDTFHWKSIGKRPSHQWLMVSVSRGPATAWEPASGKADRSVGIGNIQHAALPWERRTPSDRRLTVCPRETDGWGGVSPALAVMHHAALLGTGEIRVIGD